MQGAEPLLNQGSFVVEGNDILHQTLPEGVYAYQSPSLGDRIDDSDPVPWGSVVEGASLGNGWLKLENDTYLPLRVRGMRALRRVGGDPLIASPLTSLASSLAPSPQESYCCAGRAGDGWAGREAIEYIPLQVQTPRNESMVSARSERDGEITTMLESDQHSDTVLDVKPDPLPVASLEFVSLPSCQTPQMGQAEGQALDIVQFSAPVYFVEEEEGKLRVDIMRMGSLKGQCSIRWETVDGSAEAGYSYHARSGTVTFDEGQHLSTVEVGIIQSDVWAATLEFKLQLSEPFNCDVGLFLYVCRVKLIAGSYFPTNTYGDLIKQGMPGIVQIPKLALISELIQMSYSIRGVRWRTLLTLILDQMTNMYLYFTLHVTVYFTDVLFADDPKSVEFIPGIETSLLVPGDRASSAVVLAILYNLPMVFIHVWDYLKIDIGLNGTIRNYLRASLYRKYLNYSEQSREQVQASEMQAALMDDVSTAAKSYGNLLSILRILGRLLIILAFTLHKNPGSLWILVLMPSLMLGWVKLRGKMYLEACDKEGELQLDVARFVHTTCESYIVIAEYMQRPQMNERFGAYLTAAMKEGQIPKQQVELNNTYFPKWLGPIFIGVYVATTAKLVIEKTTSVGTFLATVSILRGIADDFGDIYQVTMDYNVIYGSVVSLVHLLNMQTDVRTGKAVNRARRAMTKEERKNVTAWPGEVVEDALSIKIVKMNFHYKPERPLFRDVQLEIKQGSSVAMMSSGQSGRSTLLKLIGQRLQPTGGQVFIPTHLRVLHVSATPLMIDGPIWDNLIFGAKETPQERVAQILDGMGMRLTSRCLESGDHSEDFGSAFPYSELAKIHLARAFIMSAEVTVMQRPFSHFSIIDASNNAMLIKMMTQLVRHRGCRMPPETEARRRPRTLFFTPEEERHAEFADQIWDISDCSIKVRPGEERHGFIRQGSP